MFSALIPIYYQLLEAYHPLTYFYQAPQEIIIAPSPTPTPTPFVLPAIGGEGPVKNIVLLGDSMIDTIPENVITKSLNTLYPTTKFNLFDYGYGSTTIDSALLRLTQKTSYLSEDKVAIFDLNPDIIVIESFAYNNFGNSLIGLEKQRAVLKEIIALIQEKSPHTKIILAATIAPNSISFANGSKEYKFTALEKIEKTKTIKLYLQNLLDFAQDQNLPVIDAYHPSLSQGEGLSQLINTSDFIHPSPLGSELFADLLTQSIKDNNLL